MQREKQKGARRERRPALVGLLEDLEARSGTLPLRILKGNY